MQANEVGEVLTNQSLNSWITEVVANEFRETRKEAVDEGLTIYTVDNLR